MAPLLANMEEDLVSHRTPLSASFTSGVSYHRVGGVPLEVSRDLEKAVKEGQLLEVIAIARKVVEMASRATVSLAVTGDSGNGMSSFVNALRGIGHEDAASAPTGVVRTTLTPARYTSPSFPEVFLWDLPGMGASDQSLEHYLRELQHSQYDLFLLIASEQFSLHHVRLAKTIQGMGKRFYVIWTKVDRDLSTTPLSRGLLLRNIQENILETLQKEGVHKPPIFLVSSLDPDLHDFPDLRKKLRIDIFNIRCSGPLEAMSCACKETINEKVASLKTRVLQNCPEDTLGSCGADDQEQYLRVYRGCFGIDDDSLLQVAWSTGRVVSEYRTLLRSQDLCGLRRADCRLRLATCSVMKMLLRLLRWVPWLGPRAVRWFARVTHKRMLHLVAQDTKGILKKILEDSTCPA